MIGIYEIANLFDGRGTAYIGSSNNIKKRWIDYRCRLGGDYHENAHLQAAWNKYGAEAFEFSVLEEVSEDMLIATEQKYLDRYFGWGYCYNIARDAVAPLRGHTFSEEHRRKLGEASKRRVWSEKSRRRASESQKRLPPCTKETREKLSKVLRGVKRGPRSAETKRKLSEYFKGSEMASKPYPSFVHREDGETIPAGRNLAKMCREHGLCQSGMRMVKNGVRSHHKGWALLEKSEAVD